MTNTRPFELFDEPEDPIQLERYTDLNRDNLVLGQDGWVYLKSDLLQLIGKPYPNDRDKIVTVEGFLNAHLFKKYLELVENYRQKTEKFKIRKEHYKTQVKALEAKMETKETVIEAKDVEIEKSKRRIQNYKTQVKALETSLEAKAAMIAKKDAEIKELKSQLEKKKRKAPESTSPKTAPAKRNRLSIGGIFGSRFILIDSSQKKNKPKKFNLKGL